MQKFTKFSAQVEIVVVSLFAWQYNIESIDVQKYFPIFYVMQKYIINWKILCLLIGALKMLPSLALIHEEINILDNEESNTKLVSYKKILNSMKLLVEFSICLIKLIYLSNIIMMIIMCVYTQLWIDTDKYGVPYCVE